MLVSLLRPVDQQNWLKIKLITYLQKHSIDYNISIIWPLCGNLKTTLLFFIVLSMWLLHLTMPTFVFQ